MLGYSRQAYYQQKKQIEKESLQYGILIDEVLEIRKNQKRLGCRKLIYKLKPFMAQHQIVIGRDAFFDLLSEHNLLVRRRIRSKIFLDIVQNIQLFSKPMICNLKQSSLYLKLIY